MLYPSGNSVQSIVRTLAYTYDNAERLTNEKRDRTQCLTAGGNNISTVGNILTDDAVGNLVQAHRWVASGGRPMA